MAISDEKKLAITEFIRNSDDFVNQEQIFEKFGVLPREYEKSLGFINFRQTKSFLEVLQTNQILVFSFIPQSRFFDPQSEFFAEDWAFGITETPVHDQIYLIASANYQKLIEGMLEIYLMSNDNAAPFGDAVSYLNSTLIQILALEDATEVFSVNIIDDDTLSGVINNSNLFKLLVEYKHAPIAKSKIVMASDPSKTSNLTNLFESLYRVFYKLKVKSLEIEKLCLALSMDKDFNAMPKPVKVDELLPILSIMAGFKVEGAVVSILDIKERLSELDNFGMRNISSYGKSKLGSGLLVIKFIGDDFPITEAIEYVNLRPIVYISLESGFSGDKLSNFQENFPEMTKILTALIKDVDIQTWVDENFNFGFMGDVFQKLKAEYDTILKDFSPIFNLEKNPGNLFRGIIEEKIREYESGKQQ